MALLDNATVLITGASSGLGVEFARQIAVRSRRILLAARRMDRLQQLSRDIAREGLSVECVQADLAKGGDVDGLVSEAKSAGVNVLINNAGLGDHGLFEDSQWERVEAMIDVNIKAVSRLTHGLIKDLIAKPAAGILNVSSIASFLPLPQMAVYAASKAFVTSFSEAVRAELRGTGVRVTALCPGPVDTEFFAIAERPSSDGAQAAPQVMKVAASRVVKAGLAALEANRPRVVPGWFVRTVMAAAAWTPMAITRFFLNRRGRGYTGH